LLYDDKTEISVEIGLIKIAFYLGVKEKYKYTTELRNTIAELNSKIWMFTFSLDEDQDIMVTTFFPFIKRLKWENLYKYLDFITLDIIIMVAENDKLSEMLK